MLVAHTSLLVILGLAAAPLEGATDDAPKSSPEQRLAFALKAAGNYRFRIGNRDPSTVKLHPEPVLRWNNKVVREDDGMLFLWTEGDKGRPLATAQFFVVDSDWHHEFQSLSQDGFDARFAGDADRWNWRPNRPGVELVRADGIDAPADSATQRLRQMKSIAERFSAAVDRNDSFDSPEQLRLLTTPVYRYSSLDQGIVDGALFAFVQGTNPEVLILIESFGSEPAARSWRYGFARMSSFNLRVYRDDRVVWKRGREDVPTRDLSSPYQFRMRAERDDSANLKKSEFKAPGE
jgi:hypothetical protein